MADVLFIKTSSLGDVIHQMPAVTELKRSRPATRISWVVEKAFAPLVALNAAVEEVIAVDTRRWRQHLHRAATWREVEDFRKHLRARDYDEIVDTQGLFRTALIAKLARGRRHGFDVQSVRERPAALFYDVRHPVDRDLHAIARNRLLSALALGHALDGIIDFGLDRSALAGAAPMPYAVLLHATARPEKEWPEPLWVGIGRVLAARGIELVLPYGTPREQERAQRIAAALSNARLPQREPLDAVARLIAGAAFVVGVDTGLLHLAAALGVPLVGIFVGSEPGLTGPKGAGPIAVVGGRNEMPSAEEVLAAVADIGC
jgi:heptosyltransferase I